MGKLVNQLTIPRSVLYRNDVGYIYAFGDETTDGSVRFRINQAIGETCLEKRVSGAWQSSELCLGASTLFLGANIGIAAAGRYLSTTHAEGGFLYSFTEFDENGVGDLNVIKLGAKIDRFVAQPDDSNEFIGTQFAGIIDSPFDLLLTGVHLRIGSVAATAPVHTEVFKGTDDTGLLIWDYNHTAEELSPANTEVSIPLVGLIDFDGGFPYYIRYTSEETFSLKINASGTKEWVALDYFPKTLNKILTTEEFISGKSYTEGDLFINTDNEKIYTCRVTGIQTGTFTDNIDKWGLISKEGIRFNDDGYLYISGDEDTDGSIRFELRVSNGDTVSCLQKRVLGAWQDSELCLGASTLFLGEGLGIAAAGGHIMGTHYDGARLHPFTDIESISPQVLSPDGTGPVKVLNLNTKIERIVAQADDSGEFIGTKLSSLIAAGPPFDVMTTKAYWKIGSVAATAPVNLKVYFGTDETGDLVFDYTFPASVFGPANTEISFDLSGFILNEFAVPSFSIYESEEPFSLRTNAAVTAEWVAFDVYPVTYSSMLKTKEFVSGNTYNEGEWFIDTDTEKIYVCRVSGVQTGTFVDNLDKWELISKEGTVFNDEGYLYIQGDEITDGSRRFSVDDVEDVTLIEKRVSGVWVSEELKTKQKSGWRVVSSGTERIIESYYDHVVSELIVEDNGILTIENEGRLVIV